jgi:phosphoribosyl 1,2-cyclic phosphodiesterase
VWVRVLGSAAGGGFPQWNCACRNCSGLDNTNPLLVEDSAERRRVESAGIEVAHDGMETAL